MTEALAPRVAIVVAIAENGMIGQGGRMPWRLSSDMKYFRRLTMGKPLIMGRKTFASLPNALDGRDNIVVTRNAEFAGEGATVTHSLGEALQLARKCAEMRVTDEIMIVGGAEIYREALGLADRIYLTRVHASPEGDTTFPLADFTGWREVAHEAGERTEKDDYSFTFLTLDRAAE
jgi:dihydrofolate reductase